MSAEDLLLAHRVVIRTARPRPPRINWLALLAVVIGLTVVAVLGGLW